MEFGDKMILITSRDNRNVKLVEKLNNSSRIRHKNGLFVSEGVRICVDAMLSNACIEVFFSTKQALEKHPDEFSKLSSVSKNTFLVTPEIFTLMSDTQTPQGFLCIIKALDKTVEFDTIKNDSKFLALECLQDPSNLGTVLRTAEAMNLSGIVMTHDCCDIFSPKVVRGSMGAVFRIPFTFCDSIDKFLSVHKNLNSYACVVSGECTSINETKFVSPSICVIGNEGNGLRSDTINSCNYRITIPMKGKAESLNASVAASIIMWEMVK